MISYEAIRPVLFKTQHIAKLIATLLFVLYFALTSAALHAQQQFGITISESTDPLDAEFVSSPYDFRLLESLTDAGRVLHESGQHRAAVRKYRDAFQLVRINYGLYHESQIPVLELLIESQAALKNWESVNKHYDYMEHLYERLYSLEDPRFEEGMRKVVAWHVNALNENLDGRRIEHLRKAHQLFKTRLKIAELTLAAGDPKIDFLLRNIAISEQQLYLASDITKELLIKQQNARRNALLAGID